MYSVDKNSVQKFTCFRLQTDLLLTNWGSNIFTDLFKRDIIRVQKK